MISQHPTKTPSPNHPPSMISEDQYQDIKHTQDNINVSDLRNEKFLPNTNKLDNQSFIEDYRALKQQQKDFLLKINMSAKLKQKLFDFTDSKEAQKPDENQKLVALIDPFKGRLIMKQKAWLEIEKQKEEERIKAEKNIFAREQEEKQKTRTNFEKKLKKAKKQKELDENNTEQFRKEKEKSQKDEQEKHNAGDNFLGALLNKLTNKSPKEQQAEEKQQQNNNFLGQINQQELPSEESENIIGSAQKLKKKKNYFKSKRESNQKNNKIHRNSSPSKQKGDKKIKRDPSQKKQMSKGKKKSNQIRNKKNEVENSRMDSKAQFLSKYNDDSDKISDIPRKELVEDLSNPSLKEDNISESEDLQHMAKSKRKGSKGRGY